MATWGWLYFPTQYMPKIIHTDQVLFCFIAVLGQSILSISFRVTSLALGQSRDCPSASEAILKMRINIHWSLMDSPHKGPVQYNAEFGIFFVGLSLVKLLKSKAKQFNHPWFIQKRKCHFDEVFHHLLHWKLWFWWHFSFSARGATPHITTTKHHASKRCAYFVAYHYNGVIVSSLASQITSLTIVYSTVYSRADQRKHQSSASLAFVWGINRWPVNSPHKGPVTRKMFPFDDVIMYLREQLMHHLTISCQLHRAPCRLIFVCAH